MNTVNRKGVTYYKFYTDARKVAKKVSGHVRNYGLGYAVQYRVSGPYYSEVVGIDYSVI